MLCLIKADRDIFKPKGVYVHNKSYFPHNFQKKTKTQTRSLYSYQI